jgi:hypothetical protein
MVTSVCALPDGHRVVSGSRDSALRVWNVDTGVCERGWVDPSEVSDPSFSFPSLFFNDSKSIHDVRVLSDGRRVVSRSSSLDPAPRVWNVDTGQHEVEIVIPEMYLDGHALAPHPFLDLPSSQVWATHSLVVICQKIGDSIVVPPPKVDDGIFSLSRFLWPLHSTYSWLVRPDSLAPPQVALLPSIPSDQVILLTLSPHQLH